MPVRKAAPASRRSTASILAGTTTLAAHVLALGVALHGGWAGPVEAPEEAGMRVQLRLIADTAVQPAVSAPPPAEQERPTPRQSTSQAAPAQPGPPQATPSVPLAPPSVLRVAVVVAEPAGAEPAADAGHSPAAAGASPAVAGAPSSTPAAAAPAGVTEGDWALEVMRRLEKFRVYPAAARSRRAQGVVLVQASIAADGRVLTARVRRSCGDADLDAEAIATFMRARRVPPPPSHLVAPLNVDVPVDFHLS